MITVANINGSPASNPRLGFGSYSDDTNFYFFESEAEHDAYIAQLNIGVPTQAEIETKRQAMITQFKAILQSCVGVRVDQLTATQVRAISLYNAEVNLGLVDMDNFKIKPLSEWIR
jgi:hypothetical protein